MRTVSFRPQFVEFIPATLTQGVLYVSEKYKTATHLCACGCGTKIVTPFRPTEWTLTKRGELVTLNPSIGNWNHPCQSHYWIRQNKVIWAGTMTRQEINIGRKIDRVRKDKYFGAKSNVPQIEELQPTQAGTNPSVRQGSLWDVLKRWFKVLGF